MEYKEKTLQKIITKSYLMLKRCFAWVGFSPLGKKILLLFLTSCSSFGFQMELYCFFPFISTSLCNFQFLHVPFESIMHSERFLFINICSSHSGISPLTREGVNTDGMHYSIWHALFNTTKCIVQSFPCIMQEKPSQVGGPCIFKHDLKLMPSA